jgi:hypothetical protein
MFEKLSRAAENAAAGVGTSRRGFLTKLGQAALGAAAAAGGVLATAARASAGGNQSTLYACSYARGGLGGGYGFTVTICGGCPKFLSGFSLTRARKIGTC